MLGRSHSSTGFEKSRSAVSMGTTGRLASFGKKFQRKHFPVNEDDDIIDPLASTRKKDFVTKLKELSRAHVVEAARSRSIEVGNDKQDESTMATENTSVDDIGETPKPTEHTRSTDNRGEDQFVAIKEMLDWVEWTKFACGPCAIPSWHKVNRKPPSNKGKIPPTLPQNKRSVENVRFYQGQMMYEASDHSSIGMLYAAPIDFEMDKSAASTALQDRSTTEDQVFRNPREVSTYQPRWTMSNTTGAETTENGDSVTFGDETTASRVDYSTTYASSLYSSFASDPFPHHFDDSTTITTNY